MERFRYDPKSMRPEALSEILTNGSIELNDGDSPQMRVRILRMEHYSVTQIVGLRGAMTWHPTPSKGANRYMFVFVARGEVSATSPRPQITAAERAVIVLLPGPEPVRLTAESPVEAIAFTFDAKEAAPFTLSPETLSLVKPTESVLRAVYSLLHAAVTAPESSETVDANAMRFLLMGAARSLISAARGNQGRISESALEIIATEYSNPALDPRRIAEHLGVSLTTLHKAFRKHPLTVSEELRLARTNAAKALRAQRPDIRTAELAQLSGFGSRKSLERALHSSAVGTRTDDAAAPNADTAVTNIERQRGIASAVVASTRPGNQELPIGVQARVLRRTPGVQDDDPLLITARLLVLVRTGQTAHALRMLEELNSEGSPDELAFHAALAEGLLGAGRAPEALAQATQLLERARSEEDGLWTYRALCICAVAHAANASFSAAERTLNDAELYFRAQHWPASHTYLMAVIAEMIIAMESGDARRLVRVETTARTLGRVRPRLLQFADVARTRLMIAEGDISGAIAQAERIAQGVTEPPALPIVQSLALHLQAIAMLQRGEPHAAADVLRDVEPTERHLQCPAVLRAISALHAGDPDLALSKSRNCVLQRTQHSLLTLPTVNLARAAAHLRLGQTHAALHAAADAFASGHDHPPALVAKLSLLPLSDAHEILDLIKSNDSRSIRLVERLRAGLPSRNWISEP